MNVSFVSIYIQGSYAEIKKQMDEVDPLAQPLLQWWVTPSTPPPLRKNRKDRKNTVTENRKERLRKMDETWNTSEKKDFIIVSCISSMLNLNLQSNYNLYIHVTDHKVQQSTLIYQGVKVESLTKWKYSSKVQAPGYILYLITVFQ